MRRSVAKAFTLAGVLDYESYIDLTIKEFVKALSKHRTIDLAEMMLFYAMDSAMRVAFGDTLGSLESETDVDGTIQLIRDRFNHWGFWSSMPRLERLVYRNPISLKSKKAPSNMAAKAVSKLRAHMAGTDGNTQVDLLDRFIKASEEFSNGLDTGGVVGMLMSTISGAGDTTATTMTAVIYYLLRNPDALRTLIKELQEAQVLGVDVPSFAEISNLPYLNAVIKESMRLFPTPNWPIERKVPAGGATISGVFFPEGTTVGCMPSAVHYNRAVFGEDADVFRPERWLEVDEKTLRNMEAAHIGFSRGRRVCLGQHVATMQMKKVIPMLVLKFEVSPFIPLQRRCDNCDFIIDNYTDESCPSQ
jgi:cytochrome P450